MRWGRRRVRTHRCRLRPYWARHLRFCYNTRVHPLLCLSAVRARGPLPKCWWRLARTPTHSHTPTHTRALITRQHPPLSAVRARGPLPQRRRRHAGSGPRPLLARGERKGVLLFAAAPGLGLNLKPLLYLHLEPRAHRLRLPRRSHGTPPPAPALRCASSATSAPAWRRRCWARTSSALTLRSCGCGGPGRLGANVYACMGGGATPRAARRTSVLPRQRPGPLPRTLSSCTLSTPFSPGRGDEPVHRCVNCCQLRAAPAGARGAG